MKNPSLAVKAVSVFAATNDIRYYLNGVCAYLKDGKIVGVAATNGVATAIVGEITIETARFDNSNVGTLANALLTSDAVSVDDGLAKIGDYSIPAADGRYPDIKRIIPKRGRASDGLTGIDAGALAKLKPLKTALLKKLKAKDRNFVHFTFDFGQPLDNILAYIDEGELHDGVTIVIAPVRI